MSNNILNSLTAGHDTHAAVDDSSDVTNNSINNSVNASVNKNCESNKSDSSLSPQSNDSHITLSLEHLQSEFTKFKIDTLDALSRFATAQQNNSSIQDQMLNMMHQLCILNPKPIHPSFCLLHHSKVPLINYFSDSNLVFYRLILPKFDRSTPTTANESSDNQFSSFSSIYPRTISNKILTTTHNLYYISDKSEFEQWIRSFASHLRSQDLEFVFSKSKTDNLTPDIDCKKYIVNISQTYVHVKAYPTWFQDDLNTGYHSLYNFTECA
ncbi:hypothetical protein TBLA_0B06370 [Henningerozyma blattae CBS 6284]|uniref:Uncharacterized protein n=1 Tax=Henningerozyma blattae (strain ATCC 34711 / CBS 6284 / DSM 70876 / NBRC 10599 / NRRL Y-10934 / UCD 77-7) TaxID=1071380 RepID=I2GZA9_HENB6|nr:hypothetical protein TBLA_0B06370 [Tetrapisispora blattae CBS 6284]CCH59461.1 hypothetical protein TBLA_0B06370 [Tetrapisispora blattae CBS 6284]